jgi:hypothetical protein
MEQMLERLLAEMRAGHEEILVEIRTNHKKMNASQEQTIAMMYAWLEEMKAWRKETTACQEATAASLKSK